MEREEDSIRKGTRKKNKRQWEEREERMSREETARGTERI